jgi:acyl phosphate:glycerol-3-phosphate acyltransferase
VRSGAVAGTAFVVGAVPWSNVAAQWKSGVDLRSVGTGTVSGTGLYEVAGFAPLAIAGIADIAKGAIGPLLAGRERPVLAAIAGGLAVAGHNWSPFLGGAGGRGISPAIGALGVTAWPGAALLLGGLAAGRITRQTALGGFVADIALVPLLFATSGRRGAMSGACVAAPMLAKRVLGNRPLERASWRGYRERILFDRDPS